MSDLLEARVVKLEQRLSRVRAIAIVLAIGFVLTVSWNLVPRSSIEAQRFMLRAPNGDWRGALMLREDGCPVVRLNDTRSRARLYGVVLPDGNARLRLTDSSGVHRVVVELGPEGLPSVRLTGADGRVRAQVGVDAEDRPCAELRLGREVRRLSLGDTLSSSD